MKKIWFIALVAIFSCSSCKKEKVNNNIQTNAKFARELRSSVVDVKIENRILVLTAYLWRDFMPSPGVSNGSGLLSINNLTTIDNTPILNTITLKKQYIVNGDEIWTADYDEIRTKVDSKLEGVVRNGPKWGPSIIVDVICEFEHAGKTYRILAKSQQIGSTS